MKKITLLAFAVAMMAGCTGRMSNTDTKLDDGHDYVWVFTNDANLQHSPECRKCKAARQEEIKQYVDSILKESTETVRQLKEE